jgi:hypothetical protein
MGGGFKMTLACRYIIMEAFHNSSNLEATDINSSSQILTNSSSRRTEPITHIYIVPNKNI